MRARERNQRQTELLRNACLLALDGVGMVGTERWEPIEASWASVQVRRRMTEAEIARVAPRALARGWRPPEDLARRLVKMRG